jgi:hypothetical protein
MATNEDYEVLGLLVAADNAAREPGTFLLVYVGGGGREIIGHAGWPDDAHAPSDLQVDELADLGWVRLTGEDGKGRTFAVTGGGRDAWSEHVAELSHVAARVELDWPAARPLLEEIYQRYQDEGAAARGVNTFPMTGDETTGRQATAVVRELVRSKLLDVTRGTADRPHWVRPTPLALRMLGGWPADGAQEVLSGLVEALNTEIDRTPDSGRRSVLVQVRDGLIGGARDVAIAYIEKKTGIS